MTMCTECDKVYDESEYSYCPYCSGELDCEEEEQKVKECPICKGIMYWEDRWECSNCGETIDTDEDDYDFLLVP